ncbi:hypothetical protein AQI95_40640 [Streptomyces yokosukanensis]|uniref:Lipoprotein n=1 Tax=Streptomyces yokosukanensis TaxID=67386 RepID=A0A117PYS2_9ACTN|nr:hypothetical protein [Streptomyces yokosukanensis]KUM99140.1 hypothetical protein AQI95_40640 [Streptomyces yokosukanensis]
MTTRRARRTVRSAGLVAVAAAAAFSLTACQGGDKNGAAPEKKVSSSASPSTGDGTALSGSKTGAGKAPTDARTQALATHHTTAPATTAKAASPVRTQTLADGSKAEIQQLGAQHYLAKIVHGGSVLATLETKQHDAGLDANDMFVVLTLDGQVHSWMGGGHTGPGTFKLAGGWTAKVTKIGDLRYRAQILGNDGSVDATLETNQQDVGLDANGVYIVLSTGGVISAHQ